MDVNLELIKRIISSDELCDKVNSGDNKYYYISQIENYVLFLISDNVNANMDLINRYLRKFVYGNKEDIFFNKVLLKLYSCDVKNVEFLNFLDSFSFNEVKELLIKKYNEYIINKSNVPNEVLIRMLSLYCYTCPKYIFPKNYIDYFVYNLYSKNVSLDYDLLSYFYKEFALGMSEVKGVNSLFLIMDDVVKNDPYYDDVKNKIVLYKHNIGKTIDPFVFSDIFYQIVHIYILKSINNVNNKVYTFEQLELVKEICLKSIMGNDYYDLNYGDVSFSTYLKKQSKNTTISYFSSLGIDISLDKNDTLAVSNIIDDDTDRAISVDIIFDQTLKNENPNLLNSLIHNYPILSSEYKNNKKKTFLTLLLDIYNNKKLLGNLNKDLSWYMNKNDQNDIVVKPKIERLKSKIAVCNSYINVMNSIIMNGDVTSYDLFRSISDLITYRGSNDLVKNDIYLILRDVIPSKIRRLCSDRRIEYKENLKKKVIKCYLDSMNLVKNEMDVDYFMKIYSTLELCSSAFDIDKV